MPVFRLSALCAYCIELFFFCSLASGVAEMYVVLARFTAGVVAMCICV